MKTPDSPDSPDSPTPPAPKEAQQLTRWTRRYLQSRNMAVIIAMLFFVFLWFFGVGTNLLLAWGIHANHPLLVSVGAVGETLWLAAIVFISVPPWGGRFFARCAARYYQREGDAELPAPSTPHRPKWVTYVVAGLFGLAILTTVFLGNRGVLPDPGKYMQPVGAVYVVPFLVFLWWWQHRAAAR